MTLFFLSYTEILLYDHTSENGKVLSSYLSHDEKWRMKVELHEISDILEKTIIYKEDKYFYYHPGVNLAAVFRALMQNIRSSKRSIWCVHDHHASSAYAESQRAHVLQ